MNLSLAPRIQEALESGRPVVALESTVITHGLPRPRNLELARLLEDTIREQGAEPATIGILNGRIVVGLSEEETVQLADMDGVDKASLWNLAAITAQGRSAGTTVATTQHIAVASGVFVFATGGIGGVHPAEFDESTDLIACARYPMITVCAGPKSILNVPATFERLETLGVPVIAYRSDTFAGFHVPLTDIRAPARADSPAEIASVWRAHQQLGLSTGMLVTNPVSDGLDATTLEAWKQEAEADAVAAGIKGKETTPYMLARLAEISDGRTVDVNIRLLEENAALAARIALALSGRGRED